MPIFMLHTYSLLLKISHSKIKNYREISPDFHVTHILLTSKKSHSRIKNYREISPSDFLVLMSLKITRPCGRLVDK